VRDCVEKSFISKVNGEKPDPEIDDNELLKEE